jgi:serine-type D-Ala-D-Ala carboxypeptidase (penicillin-binding protein 5/6)
MLAACGAAETSWVNPTAGPTGSATSAPTVDARAYAIYDEDAGRQLASSNADDRLPVGSLMKLLNAYVAYRAGEPEKAVVAPDDLVDAADESVIDIHAGQAITRGVLIRAMLKVSANDAARLLALDVAGSEERYAGMMNEAAADLALDDTHPANATGLDADGQFSSANDLITLGTHLLRDATFRQTVSEPTANLNGQTFANTNHLLGAYAGADGIKTGHTSDAGWCILASATREGRRIVVVVLGAATEEDRDDAARTLLDWGFAQSRQAESGLNPRRPTAGMKRRIPTRTATWATFLLARATSPGPLHHHSPTRSWSGRRDSNPRPSPWQGDAEFRWSPLEPLESRSAAPAFRSGSPEPPETVALN